MRFTAMTSREQVRDMGIEEVLSTPRSPWQRAYVERVICSIRRECLDHVIVFDEARCAEILASYLDYYHLSRTHLSLGKDSPEPRPVQPPDMGPAVAVSQVGGLHHRYERRRLKRQIFARGSTVLLEPLTSVSDIRACAFGYHRFCEAL